MSRIIIHLPETDRDALVMYLAMSPEDRDRHPLELTELSKMNNTDAGTMVLRLEEPKAKATQMALPLPPPPPAVGQVWVWLGWPYSSPGRIGERLEITMGDACFAAHEMEWPPEGAMLVAGPGSPWRPFLEVASE